MRADAIRVNDVAMQLPTPGIGTRQQWVRAGASARMFIDGRLVRLARGVYVEADLDTVGAARRLASTLPENGVVGGWLAAAVQGVRDAAPHMPGAPSELAVCYLTRHDHKRPPGFRPLRSDVLPEEVEVVDGLRVTTPARTAYDMARFSTNTTEAVALLDLFAWVGNPRPLLRADLEAVVQRHPKSRGNPRVRLASRLMTARSRSVAESRIRMRWVLECGIDPSSILVNAMLQVGAARAELDLVDVSSGLVGEYDGPLHGEPEQRSRDAHKDAIVDQVGLIMQRYNKPELRLGPTSFARLVGVRRDHAIKRGAAEIAQGLAARGQLLEECMTIYPR